MNIYEKMASIMEDVQYLTKDDRVEFGNTKYKALSEEKVTTVMRAELLKHKLIVYPISQASNRVGSITHVDVVYRMVNVENPEEYIEIVSCGDGADSQDKGSGKAMTYAFKYMWLRTFALPTGEDPDKIPSEDLDEEAKQPPPDETGGTQPPGPACEMCGYEIMPYSDDKKSYTSADIAARSMAMFGHRLCTKCSILMGKKAAAEGGQK